MKLIPIARRGKNLGMLSVRKATSVYANDAKKENRTAIHNAVIRTMGKRRIPKDRLNTFVALCIAGPQGLDISEFVKNGLSRENVFMVDSNVKYLKNAMRIQKIKKGKGVHCSLENLAPYLESCNVKLDIAIFDLTQGMIRVIDILAPLFSAPIWAKQCKIGVVYSKRCPMSRDFKELYLGGNYDEGFRQAASHLMNRDVSIVEKRSYRTGSNMAWNVLQANI